MQITRIFIHGLESSGRGTKGSFFRERYPDMIVEDYFGSFRQRMSRLEGILQGKSGIILAGSSFGGLMAAVYACLHPARVRRLILLAPALHLQYYDPYRHTKLRIPVVLYHGLRDGIVPLEEVRKTAGTLYLHHTFQAVNDDHSLHDTFHTLDWDTLLEP